MDSETVMCYVNDSLTPVALRRVNSSTNLPRGMHVYRDMREIPCTEHDMSVREAMNAVVYSSERGDAVAVHSQDNKMYYFVKPIASGHTIRSIWSRLARLRMDLLHLQPELPRRFEKPQ
jgi:hypothetical protein